VILFSFIVFRFGRRLEKPDFHNRRSPPADKGTLARSLPETKFNAVNGRISGSSGADGVFRRDAQFVRLYPLRLHAVMKIQPFGLRCLENFLNNKE
jgi:hypothetical protein